MFSTRPVWAALFRIIPLVALCVALNGCAGCRKKPDNGEQIVIDVDPPKGTNGNGGTTKTNGDGNGAANGGRTLPDPPRTEAVEIDALKRVYFDYDKFDLRDDTLATLENNLKWLVANPDKKIQIEGHCDERGTEEYNYSLGEKRANSVIGYLVKKGIAPDRLHPISFGESVPAVEGHNEDAWKWNRRAVFKVFNIK